MTHGTGKLKLALSAAYHVTIIGQYNGKNKMANLFGMDGS